MDACLVQTGAALCVKFFCWISCKKLARRQLFSPWFFHIFLRRYHLRYSNDKHAVIPSLQFTSAQCLPEIAFIISKNHIAFKLLLSTNCCWISSSKCGRPRSNKSLLLLASLKWKQEEFHSLSLDQRSPPLPSQRQQCYIEEKSKSCQCWIETQMTCVKMLQL